MVVCKYGLSVDRGMSILHVGTIQRLTNQGDFWTNGECVQYLRIGRGLEGFDSSWWNGRTWREHPRSQMVRRLVELQRK